MTDCLFCKIVSGAIAAAKVWEDGRFIAFRDIAPQAPTHVLVIPRQHVASLDAATDSDLMGGLMLAAAHVARLEGVAASGYRTVINTNRDAQQAVFHVHVHVLGGRSLTWPPG
jgi:histidine triad (HIT) family protein